MTDGTVEQVTALTQQMISEGAGLALWSEDKKKEFCALFKDRSACAQFVLASSTKLIIEAAEQRYFINSRQALDLGAKVEETNYRHSSNYGRSYHELQQVAQERAALVIAELPNKHETWEVLKPEVAEKMRKVDEIEKELSKISAKFDTLPTEVRISDMPETMTLKEFKAHVNKIRDTRDDCLKKMNRLAHDGNELNRQIDKELYAGNKDLATALRKLVDVNVTKIKGLSATTRRVEERVLYGDNQAALELLQGFERDELEVTKSVTSEFTGVLDRLGIGKAQRKALKGKRSKKKD